MTYRVAMIAACPFPVPRGTPVRIQRLAEALGRRGHEVHVITYHLGGALEDAPFQVHRIPQVRSYVKTAPGPTWRKLLQLDPMLVQRLGAFLNGCDVDLIHAHHYEGLLVANCARHNGIPIVYDAHTTLQSELPYYRLGLPRFLKRWLGSILDRRLPGRAEHTIAVSETIRNQLLRLAGVTPERVTVIGNGVEAGLFGAVPEKPYRQGSGEQTVVFAGNLAAYQGIDLLLQAFAKVHYRRPQARLILVTQSQFDPYEALVQRLGIREALTLRQTDLSGLAACLAEADVVVNPRVQCAGIPQKLLNYMAAGRPIVSFRGSATHLEHERTGLIVPDADTEAMARAIMRLLDDHALAERFGKAARDEVQHCHSWDYAAQKVEGVYARVLTEKGGHEREVRGACKKFEDPPVSE